MLELKNIHKSFNGIQVLKGLSGRLHKGEFISIMGCNGAGKSTFFDLISGALVPDQGQITLDGQDITQWSELQRASIMGRLFQDIRQASVSTLTVRENLALATLKGRRAGLTCGLHRFPENIVEERLIPLNLRLEEFLDVPMEALSGGQRQILSFIMATITPPRVLLLDEPTAALDPRSAENLLCFARDFVTKHQIPTLMITHDSSMARKVSDRIWVLEKGIIRSNQE